MLRFDVSPEFQVAQGSGGDRTDRGQSDACELWRPRHSRAGAPAPHGTEQFDEVLDCGRTGETDYVRTTLLIVQRGSQPGARRFWDHGFVGFDDLHLGTSFTQFARDHIAGNFRAHQQETFAAYLLSQALDNGFGYVLVGNNVYLDSSLGDGIPRGRTNSRDLQTFERLFGEAQMGKSLPHGIHTVDAGEDQPVICAKLLECSIERLEGTRFADFDERDFQDIGAKLAQSSGKSAGLVTRAADQDANAA